MRIKWDGITKSKTLQNDEVVVRQQLADAVKVDNWQETLEILNKRPDLVNITLPDEEGLDTTLHQAAQRNAPVPIVQAIISLGGWLTSKNANGERPVDIAEKKKHQDLVQLLQPVYRIKVPSDILQKIQQQFHLTILGRSEDLVKEANIRLPELEPLLEIEQSKMWFPVPGMYGGFNYWLDGEGEEAKLICESWCSVLSGSGQRHEITTTESKLVDQGFV